jgi:hypothetical protein
MWPKGAFWLVITFFAAGATNEDPRATEKGFVSFSNRNRLEQLLWMLNSWFSQLLGGRGRRSAERVERSGGAVAYTKKNW